VSGVKLKWHLFFQSEQGAGNGKPGDYRPLMDVSGKVAKTFK